MGDIPNWFLDIIIGTTAIGMIGIILESFKVIFELTWFELSQVIAYILIFICVAWIVEFIIRISTE